MEAEVAVVEAAASEEVEVAIVEGTEEAMEEPGSVSACLEDLHWDLPSHQAMGTAIHIRHQIRTTRTRHPIRTTEI